MSASKSMSPYWQYFVVSFLSIFALRYVSSSSIPLPAQALLDVCRTADQPNPIASLYPANATGTLNGTIAVLPIPLTLARQLVPSKYRILEHAYQHLLPSFAKDMYPLFVQTLHDHEVQAFGFQIPDFSRAGVEFPFLDLLGDNTTSFKWVPSLLMSAGNEIALAGAANYGIKVYPATFDPVCDAYRAVPDAQQAGTTFAGAKSVLDGVASLATTFATTDEPMFSLNFFKNVTNQVVFSDGKVCDNMIRLFDTNVTTSPNRIDSVVGSVKINMFPFAKEQEWQAVHGLRLDTAFIENNYLPCENFRGYGTSE
ncbi:hypothetical protein ACN47E_000649 [Coniothyrium glycines]